MSTLITSAPTAALGANTAAPAAAPAKMTSDQFAEQIKAKYPAYAKVDNATLTQKMLAKYPQYGDRVDLTPAAPAPTGMLGNFQQGMDQATKTRTAAINSSEQAYARKEQGFGRTAFQVGGQLVGAAVDPFTEGAKAVVKNATQNLDQSQKDKIANSPAAGIANLAGAGFNKVTDALGSTKMFQEAAAASPELPIERDIKSGQEYLNLLPAPKVTGLAARAATDATAAVADSAVAGVKGVATKTAALGGVAKEVAGNVAAPDAIMQRVARLSKGKQADFEAKAGVSVGKFLTDRKIFGNVDSITTQLYDRFQKSKGSVDAALDKLPGEYKSSAVGSMLKGLKAREASISSVGAPSTDSESR